MDEKMVPGGFGGFCGLCELVDGAKPSSPHFKSPQTAHGERNGVHFSAVLLRGGWAFCQRHFASRGPLEVIQRVGKMVWRRLQARRGHSILHSSLGTPRSSQTYLGVYAAGHRSDKYGLWMQNGSRWLWRTLWPLQACRRRQITSCTL